MENWGGKKKTLTTVLLSASSLLAETQGLKKHKNNRWGWGLQYTICDSVVSLKGFLNSKWFLKNVEVPRKSLPCKGFWVLKNIYLLKKLSPTINFSLKCMMLEPWE